MGFTKLYVAPVTSPRQGTFNGAAMMVSVVWIKSPNCRVLSRCFLYIFRSRVVWLPVLQLLKAEDASALCKAMFGSQFQSHSLSPSGMREANKMADNINSLSSILVSTHYYINVSTVILPQCTYYINMHLQLRRPAFALMDPWTQISIYIVSCS